MKEHRNYLIRRCVLEEFVEKASLGDLVRIERDGNHEVSVGPTHRLLYKIYEPSAIPRGKY